MTRACTTFPVAVVVAALFACSAELPARTFCGPNLPPCEQPLVCSDPTNGGVCVLDTFDGGPLPDAGIDAGTTPVLSITSFGPAQGPTTGGAQVTISGNGFDSGVSVLFGPASATIQYVSDVSLQVTAPPNPRGPVSIVVESLSLDASATAPTPFTYFEPIAITSISPDGGRATGGETITITGTGLFAGTTATFGLAPAKVVAIDDAGGTWMTVIAPPGLAYDPVDVIVMNPIAGDFTAPARYNYYTVTSTVAGGGAGEGAPSSQVQLGGAVFGAVHPTTGLIYLSLYDYHRIIRIESGGFVSHVAGTGEADSGVDGVAITTPIAHPRGIAFTSDGTLYFAEFEGHRIRMIDAGMLVTIAGTGVDTSTGDNGLAINAGLSGPAGLAFDTAGRLLVTERSAHVVRRIDLGSGIITRVAGNRIQGYSPDASVAVDASIRGPIGIVEFPAGTNSFVFAERGNDIVRWVSADGDTSIIAGGGDAGFDAGMLALRATLPETICVARGAAGMLLVSQYPHQSTSNGARVFGIDDGGAIVPMAGTGTTGSSADGQLAVSSPIYSPCVFSAIDGTRYFAENRSAGSRVRTIDNLGQLATVAGSGPDGPNFFGDSAAAVLAGLAAPAAVAYESTSNTLYIADTLNHRIRAVAVDGGGWISTVAGTGDAGYMSDDAGALETSLNAPMGIVIDMTGAIRFSDTNNHRLRTLLLSPPPPTVTLFAGNGTAGESPDQAPPATAQLNRPRGLAVSSAGFVYVADTLNQVVRRIDLALTSIDRFAGRWGVATSGADLGDNGLATNATLNYPTDVALDSMGNVYIADSQNHRVRRVNVDGVITTVIGTGNPQTTGDDGPAINASVNAPTGICIDSKDRLYIAESDGGVIRRVWRNAQGDEIARVVAGRPDVRGFNGDGLHSTVATFVDPTDVACANDNTLFVTEPSLNRVRSIK